MHSTKLLYTIQRGGATLAAILILLASQQASTPSQAAEAPRFFLYAPKLPLTSSAPTLSRVAFDRRTPGLALTSDSNIGGSIMRSTNDGKTWIALANTPDPSKNLNLRVVYGEAARTFYAFGAVTIYKTADAGDTWTSFPYNTNCNQILQLVAHPTDPQRLYATTTNGFTATADGGKTWISGYPQPGACFDGPNGRFALTVSATNETTIYAAGDQFRGSVGVSLSRDDGKTWQSISNGLPSNTIMSSLVIDTQDGTRVYGLTGTGTVYQTTNSGALWSALAANAPLLQIIAHAPEQGDLYGSDEQYVYRFNTLTSLWERVLQNPPSQQPIGFQGAPNIDFGGPEFETIALTKEGAIYVLLVEAGRASLPLMQNR